MSVQAYREQTNVGFIKNENSLVKTETIQQDESRTTNLLPYTVMAYVAAAKKWVPFNSVSGTDGSAMPRGIYLGDTILAATLVAGDVEDMPILVGDAIVDQNLVVYDDDTLTEDSVIGSGTIHAVRAVDALAANANIYMQDTIDITAVEN